MNGQDTAHEGAEKNERYMEGNYDNSGNIVKRYKQKADDEHRSLQIAEEIKASQEAAYERETESLSYEYQAVGEAFTELMKAYIEEDKYQQYLVDGAVLRCSQATTEDFDYNGGTVVLENKVDEVCNIVLDVHENPISGKTASDNTMIINGHRYATVTDTLQGFNINPPKCNCRLAADRISEHEKIRADGDRNKNGVCMHLMRLNSEWDNYRVEGTEYLKKDDAIMVFDTGEDGQAVQVDSIIEHRGVEGITMTSVLFCKHGGLIMPVTSGQEQIQQTQETASESEVMQGELVNVKKEILRLVEKENGIVLVEEYLDEVKANNPDYVQFLDLLAERESRGSGDYKAVSGTHLGRYQIGNDTFIQIGFKNGDLEWTQLARSFGIGVGSDDRESFLNNETAQEVAILFALRWDYQQVVSYGDHKMIGSRVGNESVEVTCSGLIAAGHLVGTRDLHRGFTGEKSWEDIKDGNKTKATVYMEQMGGLDLSGILGGID